jgi:hypothetical protein
LADRTDSPVLAIYSSALANVYFTDRIHRASLYDVEKRAPGLLSALVNHPGVGIVVVRCGDHTVVLHRGGSIELDTATDNEIEFLRIFDEPAFVRRQLLHLANMPSAGDLLVFGAYDGTTVVNFEDHGGAHGGLGGVQMFPFMVAPQSIDFAFEAVEDAVELNAAFVNGYQWPQRPRQPQIGAEAEEAVSRTHQEAAAG